MALDSASIIGLMPDPTDPHRGYWYADSDEAQRRRAIDLLQAFRLYRAAEVAMRRRTRESMSMGENDLLVLRYLLKAKQQQREIALPELAGYLAVSTSDRSSPG